MKTNDQQSLKGVALIGLAMMILFGIISFISDPFEYGQSEAKPILVVVALLLAATGLSILATRFGLRVVDDQKRLFWLVLTFAIGFRAVMLLTPPILEIDYYRYLWDGKVVQAGVSPYRYAPQTVLDASLPQSPSATSDQGLETLARLASSPSNHEILSRVHYAELTTIYPPVSQFVFWAVAKIVPAQASVWLHVVVIRAAFVLFDLGTILLLAVLLRKLNRHLAWLMAYAWNPLLIKEIANSGHLDSLAVFLMVLAVLLLLKVRSVEPSKIPASILLSAIALALAVGAKLFPVILAPAFVVRLTACGWKSVAGFCAAFLITCVVVLYPMADTYFASAKLAATKSNAVDHQAQPSDRSSYTDPDGLSKFLSGWRMNDAIFSSIYFNLKPDRGASRNYWYVITSRELRQRVAELQNTTFFGTNPAFTLARMITLSLFAIVYLAMLPRLSRSDDQGFLVGVLVVLLAFLMLQPTINPWYWVWVIPFTCFDSRWSWPSISGVLAIYYTRFFFEDSNLQFACLQRSYQGVEIFDHFVVWIELILILLFVTLSRRRDVEQSASRPVL